MKQTSPGPGGPGRRVKGRNDMAGCCGAQSQPVDYLVTFKHDGSQITVSSLQEARMKLAASPQGGTKVAVPRKAK